MKVTKVIFSPTGGTRKVLDSIIKGLNISSDDITEIGLMNKKMEYTTIDVDPDSLVIIGMPSYSGRAPKTAMKRLSKLNGNGAKCVLVVSYGNREYEDTLIEMYDGAIQCGFVPIAAAAGIAEHSIDRTMAKDRPDINDEEVLISFGQKILMNLESAECDMKLENVPGNRPYKDLSSGSNCPRPDEKCVKCGKCREYCPVGAIGEFLKGNPKKCISCMGCIHVCHKNARALDDETLDRIHGFLQAACTTRKEPELFMG